jgi:hypothetical protein
MSVQPALTNDVFLTAWLGRVSTYRAADVMRIIDDAQALGVTLNVNQAITVWEVYCATWWAGRWVRVVEGDAKRALEYFVAMYMPKGAEHG